MKNAMRNLNHGAASVNRPWGDFKVGKHRAPCPQCDRGERDKALSVRIDVDGGGVAYCHRCGFTTNWRRDRGERATAASRPATAAPPRIVHETLSG